MKIFISDDYDSVEDLSDALEHIFELIKDGNTSGYYPTWYIGG
jgi:hypothetical protein